LFDPKLFVQEIIMYSNLICYLDLLCPDLDSDSGYVMIMILDLSLVWIKSTKNYFWKGVTKFAWLQSC